MTKEKVKRKAGGGRKPLYKGKTGCIAFRVPDEYREEIMKLIITMLKKYQIK